LVLENTELFNELNRSFCGLELAALTKVNLSTVKTA